MKMKVLLLFHLVGYLVNLCHSAPQCLDENGHAVDWFALFKLPRIEGHSNYNINNGTGYIYITSDSIKTGWQLSELNISDSRSIPGKTLDVVYKKFEGNEVDDLFWIFYNDAAPYSPDSFTDGHSKGLVLGNHDGGLWIIHSVPNFPYKIAEGYKYPTTGHRYGQSFLCITLNKTTLDRIGDQLIVNAVHTYDYNFEGNLRSVYPRLYAAAKKERNHKVKSKLKFRSVGSVPFTSFAKSAKFNADLYSDLVAEELKSGLLVETWLHDGKLPANCSSSYQILNIMRININNPNVCKFENFDDHSKFAISERLEDPWVCIGDINHWTTQFKRAGGTVCFENEDLWKAYYSIVIAEPCPAAFVKNTPALK